MIDGTDVSAAIRTPEIDRATTRVARLPRVRAELVARQRALAEQGPLVMEGRDIGTVVFPAAAVKIYLDASPEERARRRAHDPAHAPRRRRTWPASPRPCSGATRTIARGQASPLSIAADARWSTRPGDSGASRVARNQVLAIVRARRFLTRAT